MDVTIYQRAFESAGNPAARIRRELSEVLRRIPGLERRSIADVLLVVTELVTNVCLHASCAGDVAVHRAADVVTVEVRDRNPVVLPRRRPADPTAPSGRGLGIVQRLTSLYAVEVAPDHKRIRVQIPLAAGD